MQGQNTFKIRENLPNHQRKSARTFSEKNKLKALK